MPLKNPSSIPKIPKPRKRKPKSVLEAIPEKKPDNIEYACSLFFSYDEALREQFTTIAIETLKEFAVFAYEISVEVIRKGRKFYIILRGLSAKTNTVPGVQPARCELNFKDLAGEYTVYVVKQDGAINGAYYKIRPQDKALKLVKVTKPRKKNNRYFCEFDVDRERDSFKEEF